jgi:tRNA (guanine37-N1)-methyltransferase
MTFDIVTIFPAMIEAPLAGGVLGRAVAAGLLEVKVHDLRDFTSDRHRVVDDVPYGGGPGMVLKADPVFRALDRIEAERGKPLTVIMTSPQGSQFTQAEAERLSGHERLVFLCGRYEGFDERVRSRVSEELSIGDYVLTGGELPALVMIDAIARLKPGVVGDEQSVTDDSFSRGLLDFPHYTRPSELRWPERGSEEASAERVLRVPDVLLSGHHAEIRRWRKREALARTLARRPELLETAALDDEERRILADLQQQFQQMPDCRRQLQDYRIAGLQDGKERSAGKDQRSKK